MEEKQVVNDIRNYFEKDKGLQFAYELHRFRNLYEHIIPERDFKHIIGSIRFNTDTNGFLWKDDYSLKLIQDNEGNTVYRFENDFKVSGDLSYWVEGNHEAYKIPCSFSLTLRAHKYPAYVSSQGVELWTEEQKIINKFNDLIYTKYDELGFKSPNSKFDEFAKIWSNVNRSNKDQVYATSHDYFYELVHSFDQAMFLLANVNLYRKFTTDYTENESYSPNGNYFIVNLSFYDRRYLDFCSLVFEKIYSFWERVAFLLFQFIKPSSLKEEYLSFAKLIKSLKDDVNAGHFGYLKCPTSNFNWFCDFLNSRHKRLTTYRHPAIHFKKKNPVYKGGLFAGTYNFWLWNNSDKAKLEKLQKENESLCELLNDQLRICEEGLNKIVELINEIPTTEIKPFA